MSNSRVSADEDHLRLFCVGGGIEMEDAEFEQWMTQKNDWYLEMVDTLDPTDIFPGVSEFILHLRNIGVRVALGSASKNAITILSKLEIQDLFDCIVDGNSVKRGKPAPDTFLKAIEDTDINPEEAIVFEDSVSGIEAALSGGFYAVGVGDPDALQKAHVIIPGFEKIDLSELIIDLIESRLNK